MVRPFIIALLTLLLLHPSAAEESSESEIRQEEFARKDSPFVVTADDVDNGQVKFENDFTYTQDRGDTSVFQIPVLVRVDTGPETEFRFRYDFLSYSDPTFGFGDATVGFKWSLIEEKKTNLAIIGEIELPVGSADFEADAVEYFGIVAFSRHLTPDWEVSLNLTASSLVDSDSVRYTTLEGATQLAYILEDDQISLGLSVCGPLRRSEGAVLTNLNLGYSHNVRPGTDITLNLERRLSTDGPDFSLTLGFGQTF